MSFPVLTAEGLARLLAAASRRGLEAECLEVIRHSATGSRLLGLLRELAAAIGGRFTWDHAARLLLRVQTLEQRLGDWPLPLLQRNPTKEPIEDIYAAARLRCAQAPRRERAAAQELERLLSELPDIRARRAPSIDEESSER